MYCGQSCVVLPKPELSDLTREGNGNRQRCLSVADELLKVSTLGEELTIGALRYYSTLFHDNESITLLYRSNTMCHDNNCAGSLESVDSPHDGILRHAIESTRRFVQNEIRIMVERSGNT